MEIWKDIPGYEGLYQISNLGNVKSFVKNKKGKIMKQATHYHGYKHISLTKNKIYTKKYVHRLVALAFIPNKDDKKEINHKDGNKQNNRVENLEWCTRRQNVLHSYKYKLLMPKRSKNHPLSKPINQYDLEGNFIKSWHCINDASRNLNIKDISISRCCRGLNKTAGNYKWEYKI